MSGCLRPRALCLQRRHKQIEIYIYREEGLFGRHAGKHAIFCNRALQPDMCSKHCILSGGVESHFAMWAISGKYAEQHGSWLVHSAG